MGMSGLLCSLFLYFFFMGQEEGELLADPAEEATGAFFQQERLFMTKDLLFVSPEGERMQMRVRGKKSTLVMQQESGKPILTEYMSGIKGFLQEKLYYEEGQKPIQNLVYFEAEQAEYDNFSGMVDANRVKLLKLLLPGHGYSENVKSCKRLMEGTTERIHFSLLENKSRFSAEKFHARFQGRKKI